MRSVVAILVLGTALAAGCGGAPAWEATRTTEGGAFTVTVRPGLDPIVINRIHEWTLHIETADGRPVDGATIVIDGGMPEHQHGLPTRPEVTADLGDGDYRVEGMKFNMTGYWVLRITVESAGLRDVAVFALTLP
jgi:hypothetical protein